MTILGYDSLHHGGPAIEQQITKALQDGAPPLSNIDPVYDAFSDIGQLSRRFVMLDQHYRGSHFVLTVRPVDAWIDSRRRHVENNIRRKAAGEYDGRFVVVDEAKWRDEWTTHTDKVRKYFADRAEFLEIDLTAGQGWAPLCGLLGVAEPELPFPWANRDASTPRGR